MKPGKEKILKALLDEGALSYTKLREMTGLSDRALSNYLKGLVEDQYVVKDGESGKYRYRVLGEILDLVSEAVNEGWPSPVFKTTKTYGEKLETIERITKHNAAHNIVLGLTLKQGEDDSQRLSELGAMVDKTMDDIMTWVKINLEMMIMNLIHRESREEHPLTEILKDGREEIERLMEGSLDSIFLAVNANMDLAEKLAEKLDTDTFIFSHLDRG